MLCPAARRGAGWDRCRPPGGSQRRPHRPAPRPAPAGGLGSERGPARHRPVENHIRLGQAMSAPNSRGSRWRSASISATSRSRVPSTAPPVSRPPAAGPPRARRPDRRTRRRQRAGRSASQPPSPPGAHRAAVRAAGPAPGGSTARPGSPSSPTAPARPCPGPGRPLPVPAAATRRSPRLITIRLGRPLIAGLARHPPEQTSRPPADRGTAGAGLLGLDLATTCEAAANVEPYLRADGTRI
jgi:hypothetical protein